MKGISTIIAAIMLTVITIGLVATAYLYFSSIVQVGPVVSITAAYCQKDNEGDDYNITVAIRNDGTAPLDESTLTWLLDGSDVTGTKMSGCSDSIDAGSSNTCVIDNVTSGVHNFVVIGPRNQAGGPVTC